LVRRGQDVDGGGGRPSSRARRHGLGGRSRLRRLRSPEPALRLDGRRPLLARTGRRAAGDRGDRAHGSLNSPRATTTAEPPTSTRSTASAEPLTRAWRRDGRAISSPCEITTSSPNATRPWRARCSASGPAAEPVAGSSGTPAAGEKFRVFHCAADPATQLVPTTGSSDKRPRSGPSPATATGEGRTTETCLMALSLTSTASPERGTESAVSVKTSATT